MAKVNVNVRFDYFSVLSSSNNGCTIDIAPLLEQFKGFSSEKRSMGYVQGNSIKILKVEYKKRYTYSIIEKDKVITVPFPFWYVVFTRSRPDLPGVLKGDATSLVPLDLPDDEYISEDTVFLYDPQKDIAIIQRNLTGTPPKAIQTMFNLHITENDKLICLAPILDTNAISRAKAQLYHKALVFRVPHVSEASEAISEDSHLKAIMESAINFSKQSTLPLELEVSIKIPGRSRDYALNEKALQDTINELSVLSNNNLIDILKVRGATDEAAQIEEIDLIKGVIRGKVKITTDESRFVNTDEIMERMIHDYSQRRHNL